MRYALLAIFIVATAGIVPGATYTVINTADSGAGSLRQAIIDANTNAGTDEIAFNVPSSPVSIAPTTLLPPIIGPVHINGASQPGYTGTPLVELIGSQIAFGEIKGLHITGGGTTVTALTINRCGVAGIKLETGGSNAVRGCFLGIDPAATQRLGSNNNVYIVNSNNNRIGGTAPGDRNIISGAGANGITIEGSSGNVVLGNYFGTNATGTALLHNQSSCIELINSSNNIMGGTTTQARNVMGGGYACITMFTLSSGSCSNNQVLGNYLGVDVTGMNVLPTLTDIISIQGGGGTVSGNIIGGATAGAGNVICGAADAGLELVDCTNSIVQGNYIGVAADGVTSRPNENGMYIWSASNSLIGGNTPAAKNVISGNNIYGMLITNGASANTIKGNVIGLDAFGNALGNRWAGININAGASNNTIGGIGPNDGNVISANATIGFDGFPGAIRMETGCVGNAILGNSIYDNFWLAIDLGNNGVTANDPGDADTGANNLQNSPVLTVANTDTNTGSRVAGTLNSAASQTYRLEFFTNPLCDSDGNGEGRTFVGYTNVTTNAGGTAAFVLDLPTVPVANVITSTATDSAGNTSEFSACQFVSLRTTDAELWNNFY